MASIGSGRTIPIQMTSPGSLRLPKAAAQVER